MMRPVLVVLDNALDDPQPALRKGARLARQLGAPLELYLNCWSGAMSRAIGFDTERLEGAIKSVIRNWEKRLRQLLDEIDAGDAQTHLVREKSDFPFLARLILSSRPELIVIHTEHAPAIQRLLMTPREWRLLRKAPATVICVGDATWPSSPGIITAVDVDETDDALTGAVIREGRRLADLCAGHLYLTHVVEFPDEATLALAESDLVLSLPDARDVLRQKQDMLEELARQHGIPVADTLLLQGNPAHALARHLADHPGLLVVGTVYRGVVKRLLMGSTAEHILRHSEQDIMVVKPDDFVSPWQDSETSSPR